MSLASRRVHGRGAVIAASLVRRARLRAAGVSSACRRRHALLSRRSSAAAGAIVTPSRLGGLLTWEGIRTRLDMARVSPVDVVVRIVTDQ